MGAQNPTQTKAAPATPMNLFLQRRAASMWGMTPKQLSPVVTSPANPGVNQNFGTPFDAQAKPQNPIIAPVRTGPASPFAQDSYQRFMY